MSTMRAWACGLSAARRRAASPVADQHVVDVPALAAQEALVLDALDLLAEQLRGHACPPAIVPSASSAARSTDFTMFG